LEADIQEVVNRDESVGLMEPMRLDSAFQHRVVLTDLALELATTSEVSIEVRRLMPAAYAVISFLYSGC
jgi:hypothetical protein